MVLRIVLESGVVEALADVMGIKAKGLPRAIRHMTRTRGASKIACKQTSG